MTEPQSIRCKAAICWGPDSPLTVEEIEVEPPRASEVRLRVPCASLCHTDANMRNGFPTPLYPRVLGHEGVGVIESVGEGVEHLEEGDVVIPTMIGECRDCRNCRSGKTNMCNSYPLFRHGLMPDMTSRMSVRGQKLYHLFTCSTFAEFTVVNANYVVKVDAGLERAHASILSCGFTSGFGASWKAAGVEEGSSVAVFGLGGVGIGATAGAKFSGASKIIGVDPIESKKEKVKLYGMTDFINPKNIENKTVAEVIKEMTGGVGVDYSIVCTGAGPALNEAFQATAPGRGLTVVLGAAPVEDVAVSRMALLLGATLKGSIFGGIRPRSDLPAIVEKCMNKEIQLDEMITHEVDLSNINQAFELLKTDECLKVVVRIKGGAE